MHCCTLSPSPAGHNNGNVVALALFFVTCRNHAPDYWYEEEQTRAGMDMGAGEQGLPTSSHVHLHCGGHRVKWKQAELGVELSRSAPR